MITHKIVDGEVVYNDGSFAEVETFGVEGLEQGLFLSSVQFHAEGPLDTPEEFRLRFPVGTLLRIQTTTVILPVPRIARFINVATVRCNESER